MDILTATTISRSMLDSRKLKFYENLGRVDESLMNCIKETFLSIKVKQKNFFTNY